MPSTQQLLTDLVRLPSVNPMGRTDVPASVCYESRVTDYLEAKLKELGVSVRRQPVAPGRDNLIATYEPTTPVNGTFLFEAHQDTVPTDGMTIDPFGGVVRDGKLFGRGACDVKAGIAAMFAAFSRLVKEKPAGAARVILAFTVDEEHTFLGIQRLVKSGIQADFAVVAEPTNLEIVTAHKGVARWQIETTGRACHSSRPQDGENAIYHMARVIYEVENYAETLADRKKDPLLGRPTISLGRIEGGTSPNTVPDYCKIEVDRRLIPGETPTAAVADLEAFLTRDPNTADLPFQSSIPTLACPALSQNQPEEFVTRLERAIATVAGPRSRIAVPYGTDASSLSEAGIPAVVFGPGDIAQAHTRDEWIELKSVDRAAEILFRFVVNS